MEGDLTADRVRVTAQVVLTVVAVLAGLGAAFRLAARGGLELIRGERVTAEPSKGPVGMRPFLRLRGFESGKKVTVYLCANAASDVDDCASLGQNTAPATIRSNPIPKAFPDANEIVPASYVLRAGPDDQGEFPVRGSFEVVPFKIGSRPKPRSFGGVEPQAIRVGEPKVIARGAPCRPPLYLPDGRLAIGANIVDPATGVTIEFDVEASELAWSPVGDKLAILTTDRKEIRLAGPDGEGAVASVREARGLLSSLSWSPQGDRLAFIAQNDPTTRGGPGPPTVRILNSVTGEVTSAGPGLAVAWSSRPDLLAVEMGGRVLQASSPSGERRRLGTGQAPSWSPDGALLAFVSTVAGEGAEKNGWISKADGSEASPVVGAGACALSFSPAGDTIAVVVSAEEGRTSLALRSIEAQR